MSEPASEESSSPSAPSESTILAREAKDELTPLEDDVTMGAAAASSGADFSSSYSNPPASVTGDESIANSSKASSTGHQRNVSWGDPSVHLMSSSQPAAACSSGNSNAEEPASSTTAPTSPSKQEQAPGISPHDKPPLAPSYLKPLTKAPRQESTTSQHSQSTDIRSADEAAAEELLRVSTPFRIRPRLNSASYWSANGGGSMITIDMVRQQTPRETEAETYILQALEERDPTYARPRANTDLSSNSGIFSHVPDSAIDSLTQNGSKVVAPKSPGSVSTKSQHSELSGGNNTTDDDDNGEGNMVVDGEGDDDVSSMGTPRTVNTRMSPTRMTGSKNASMHSRGNRHRRSKTLEEKLVDLTAAMDLYQTVHLSPHHTQDFYAEETMPWEASLPSIDEAIIPQAVPGSAGAFQQNAGLLYRRNKAPTPAPAIITKVPSSDTTSSDDGDYIVETSRMPSERSQGNRSSSSKKDDDLSRISEGDADEELGVSSPSDNKAPELLKKKLKKEYGYKITLFREFSDFFSPQRHSLVKFIKYFILCAVIPLVGVAAILFYLGGNPPVGILENGGKPVNGTLINTDGDPVNPKTASISWWLLFILRQLVLGSLAKATEFFFIDFLSIRSQFSVKLIGPWLTLFIMQSRGWPFLISAWGIYDLCLLSGANPKFSSHWMFYQDFIELFSPVNPSGNVMDNDWYFRVVIIAIVLGLVVTIKRFWLGLYLGRQTYVQYSARLTSVMKDILLITQVASLARKFERQNTIIRQQQDELGSREIPEALKASEKKMEELFDTLIPDESSVEGQTTINTKSVETGSQKGDGYDPSRIIDPEDRHPLTGSLAPAQKAKITHLLGAWEEPKVAESVTQEAVSVNSVLQFRRALAYLRTPVPFSNAFGLADTRETCIENAQEVYQRLLTRSLDETKSTLNFEVIALLGVMADGELNQDILKDLIRLFRPDRDGNLDILAFVKSIDQVYKELRLLRASVANASKIDSSLETILNLIFYVIVATVILGQLGFDPLALFLSVSGVVLAFAFMISSASSKYFEGLLFILVRRPFQIGDCIHISNPESDTSASGSSWWTVEDTNLFSTKVVFLFTMERASLSNGSLANSRIINSSDSPQAYLWFKVKFPVDVSFEKLQIFHKSVESFIFNRPKEWLSYIDFRATGVEHDKGYVDYLVGAQHRSSWAEWSTIMLSKHDLVLFCMELQKKLGIYFKTPPLPIELLNPGNTLAPMIPQEDHEHRNGDEDPSSNRSRADSLNMSGIQGLESLFPHRAQPTRNE